MGLVDREARLAYDRNRRNSPEAKKSARETARLWRINNPQRSKLSSKKWREENPEKAKLLNKKWRDSNVGRIAGYRQKYKERTRHTKRVWNKNNSGRVKLYYVRKMLKKGGVPVGEIAKAITAWGSFDGICHACGATCSANWVTDHDHEKLTFRGIIGSECNLSLGLLKDDPLRFRNLASYLERRPQ